MPFSSGRMLPRSLLVNDLFPFHRHISGPLRTTTARFMPFPQFRPCQSVFSVSQCENFFVATLMWCVSQPFPCCLVSSTGSCVRCVQLFRDPSCTLMSRRTNDATGTLPAKFNLIRRSQQLLLRHRHTFFACSHSFECFASLKDSVSTSKLCVEAGYEGN